MSRDLIDQLELYEEIARRESSRSLHSYLNRVFIDSRPYPRPFGEIAEPWQWQLAESKLGALESVTTIQKDYTGPRFFWDTLPRGHDKTSFIARTLNWLLGWDRGRHLNISAAASDSEQAALIQQAMEKEAQLNPWFGGRLEFFTRTVKGPGGRLRILAADASGTFGRTDDVVICDELTHWKKRDLFDTLYSGAEKRAGQSLFFVITNAGVLDSWQDQLRTLAREDKTGLWKFWEAPGPIASWMTPEAIARLARALPPAVAKRVLYNIWIDPSEESGYLTRLDIQLCARQGLIRDLQYQEQGTSNIRYYVGIDYGPKKDRTVCSILHKEPDDKIIIDRMDVRMRPKEEIEVPISWVENWIDEVANGLFRVNQNGVMVIDPYQMLNTIQNYEQTQAVERFEYRGGKRNYEMAEGLRTMIVNKQILWYPDCGRIPDDSMTEPNNLEYELRKLVLRPMSYGYRFDHELTEHDDRAVSIGMPALYAAKEATPPWLAPPLITPPQITGNMFGINVNTERRIFGVRVRE